MTRIAEGDNPRDGAAATVAQPRGTPSSGSGSHIASHIVVNGHQCGGYLNRATSNTSNESVSGSYPPAGEK